MAKISKQSEFTQHTTVESKGSEAHNVSFKTGTQYDNQQY